MENNQSTFFIYCSWWRYKACNYTWRSVVNPLLSQIVFQINYFKRFIIQKIYFILKGLKAYFQATLQVTLHNGTIINSIMWKIFSFFRFKIVYFWYFLHAFLQSKCESHICFQIFQIINIYILLILDQTKLWKWIRRAVFVRSPNITLKKVNTYNLKFYIKIL